MSEFTEMEKSFSGRADTDVLNESCAKIQEIFSSNSMMVSDRATILVTLICGLKNEVKSPFYHWSAHTTFCNELEEFITGKTNKLFGENLC